MTWDWQVHATTTWLQLMVALIDCVWSMARLTVTMGALNGRSARSNVQSCNIYQMYCQCSGRIMLESVHNIRYSGRQLVNQLLINHTNTSACRACVRNKKNQYITCTENANFDNPSYLFACVSVCDISHTETPVSRAVPLQNFHIYNFESKKQPHYNHILCAYAVYIKFHFFLIFFYLTFNNLTQTCKGKLTELVKSIARHWQTAANIII